MKKIALIVLYFGKLPEYTKLFFESLKYNPTIDLLLFTDQSVQYDGKNLILYKTTFENIVERIQACFDFKIVCDRPYKLCDYKTAYGYIFRKELQNYDYWGHCDLDMILGDVRRFLPESILSKYEKIYQYGHMSFYRNTEKNNTRFMQDVGMNYRKVFTTPVICVFDEVEGIQKKFDMLGIKTYKQRDCADISPWHDSFQRVESYLPEKEKACFNYREQIFYWEKGHLFRAYVDQEKVCKDEFSYLHFQRRKMPYIYEDVKNGAFYITREGIVRKETRDLPSVKIIKEYNSSRRVYEIEKRLEYFRFIWKRRINKYLLGK